MWGNKYRVKDTEPVVGWSAHGSSARSAAPRIPAPSGKKSIQRLAEPLARHSCSVSAGSTASSSRGPLGLGIISGKSTRSTSKTAPASSSSSTLTPKATKAVRPDMKDLAKLSRFFERAATIRQHIPERYGNAASWPSSVNTLLGHPSDAGFDQWCIAQDARFPEQSMSPAAADSESSEPYSMEALQWVPQPVRHVASPVVGKRTRTAPTFHTTSSLRSPTVSSRSAATRTKSKEDITPLETPVTLAQKAHSACAATEIPPRPSCLPEHAAADPTSQLRSETPPSAASPSIAALSSADSTATLEASRATCKLPTWMTLCPNPKVTSQFARLRPEK